MNLSQFASTKNKFQSNVVSTTPFGNTNFALVESTVTDIKDIISNLSDSEKFYENVNDSDYESKNTNLFGAVKVRFAQQRGVDEANLSFAYPLNSLNYTLPVKGEIVNITTIGDKYYYEKVHFQNTPSFNTKIELFFSLFNSGNDTSNSTSNQSFQTVSQTGIANSTQTSLSKTKTNDLKQGKYYKRNIKIHALKPNEGDTIIQSKFGSSIRFSGYIHDEKNEGPYPAILIRNRENSNSINNTKVYGVTTENINSDGTSIHITSGTYKSLLSPTINVVKEANTNYPSSDDLIGDQMVVNSGRLIFSSRSNETFFFSKKTFSIFTDDIVTIDSQKGMRIISQNGNIELNAKANKNLIFTVANGGKIFLGNESADQQAVLGNELVNILKELIDLINTMQFNTFVGPTLPGPITKPNFTSLKNRLNTILSKTNFLK